MSKNNPNTEEILDAIKNMMSESTPEHDQALPKDVIELTNPVNEKKEIENDKIGILELSNPIGDEKNEIFEEDDPNQDEKNEFLINDKQIKRAVRKAINALPRKQLDEIINAELTKIIQERINSSKIIISTENKKN